MWRGGEAVGEGRVPRTVFVQQSAGSSWYPWVGRCVVQKTTELRIPLARVMLARVNKSDMS